MRRALWIGLSVAAVVLITAGVFLFWASTTQQGLHFVWNQVAPRLPGEVTAERVEGRLAGPITVTGVRVDTEDYQVRLDHVDLEWRPLSLLTGVLDIELVAVRGADVIRLPRETPSAEPAEPAGPAEPATWLADLDLPLDIRVRDARMDDVRLLLEPDGEPFIVERARAAGRVSDETLVLERLELEGPLLEVRGDLAVAGAARIETDPLETDSRLQWRLRPAGYPELTGTTRVEGTLAALNIEQETDPPYASSMTLRLREPLGEASFEGELTLDVQTADIDPELLDASLGVDASFRGTLQEAFVTGRAALDAREPADEAFDARWSVRYADGIAEVETLELHHGGSPARLVAAGELTADPALAVDLRGTWSGLAYPPGEDAPTLRSDSGTFALEGGLDDYQISVEGALSLPDGTEARLAARAAGGSDSLVLDHVALESAAGIIEGEGEAQWSPRLAGGLRLTATDLDPAALDPGWPGRLAVSLSVEALLDESDELLVHLETLEADGVLRELPFEMTAQGRYGRGTADIDALSLRSGESLLEASGAVAERVDVRWRIESPDLADFGPELSGSLNGSGAVEGPLERPFIRAEASGRDLAAPGVAVGRLTLDVTLDSAGETSSTVTLSVREAELQQTVVDDLRLDAEGTAAQHALELTASTELGDVDLRLTGTAEHLWEADAAWRFELQRASVDHAAASPWQLDRPATGRLTTATAELSSACWVSGPAELCLEGRLAPQESTARFSLTEMPLDYLAALMAEPVPIEGSLSMQGWFEQAGDTPPTARVELASSPGRIYPAALEDEPEALGFGPAEGHLALADDRIESRLLLPLEQEGRFELLADLGPQPDDEPGMAIGPRPLTGWIEIEVPRLELVQPWFAELTDVGGSIEGRVDFMGTVDDPEAVGRLALSDGQARIRALNVTLTETEIVIVGDGTGELAVEGTTRSGEGTARVDGEFLLAAPGPIGRLSIVGGDLLAMDTIDGQLFVSPDLVLVLEPERLEITGTVTVPRGTLTPRDVGQFAVTVSEDEIIVDEEQPEEPPLRLPPFFATIDVMLGEELFFEGYGLTGRLAGAIRVEEEPDEPLQGVGELRVEEGTYEAYGQELEVRTGRLLFAGGSIARPSLDIEAVRQPTEDILVGARVRGTPDRPELTLFSEPPMPQQDQLSYLALGRPLQDASDSEAMTMSNAALALGLRGGRYVSDRLQEGLGFEEFGIRTQPGEPLSEAAFVIGTYLSPSLYVSYGIGLFEPETTLRLHYRISRRLQLVTESSSERSGGDLIYHIERGD